jgi:hypothetical protein
MARLIPRRCDGHHQMSQWNFRRCRGSSVEGTEQQRSLHDVTSQATTTMMPVGGVGYAHQAAGGRVCI